MGYGFTEEQDLFRSSVRKLVDKEIVPMAREIGNRDEIPRDLWRKVCELGIVEIAAPEKYGGQPRESTMLGIAAEELGKGDVSLAATLVPNIGFCLLMRDADEEVRETWLPQVIRGQKLSCLAVTEPDCGTDAAAIKMSAARVDDHYVLNGEKSSVAWGMYADVATVLAKTAPNIGSKGVSCFLLPLDSPGITKSNAPDLGLKPVTRPSLILDNVRIPKAYRIGQEGEGFFMVIEAFDLMRVLVSLISLGAAQTVIEETMEYVKQRIAFGKPVGRFEGVSFKITEAATLIEAARSLCYRALGLRDQGLKHRKETAMCKWWSTKIAVDVIHEALLLHGHFGYSEEALIEQRLRDVIGNQLADGSPEGMKLILVRELLGKAFLPY